MASQGLLGEWLDESIELLLAVKNTLLRAILAPLRLAVSRQARRAYIASILLGITIFTLFATAILAYVLFYLTYLPRAGFERNIYLQFDHVLNDLHTHHTSAGSSAISNGQGGWRRHPYGSVSLAPDLVSAQAYDVTIELTLPRTRENCDAGNFMLETSLLASTWLGTLSSSDIGASHSPPWLSGQIHDTLLSMNRLSHQPQHDPSGESIQPLAVSRRSAILPYRSLPLEILHRFTQLHLYLFEMRSEVTTLTVPAFEGIAFRKPRLVNSRPWISAIASASQSVDLPAALRLEIQSSHRLQIYSAKAVFRARFSGLRWWMHHHRFLAGLVCIAAFWMTEVVFAILAWAAVAVYAIRAAGQEARSTKVKSEAGLTVASGEDPAIVPHDDSERAVSMSDTERIFPTLRGQPPLRYTSPVVKQEQADSGTAPADPVLLRGIEADDEGASMEDDDDDYEDDFSFRDSGVGTGLESSTTHGGILPRRRRQGRPRDFKDESAEVKSE